MVLRAFWVCFFVIFGVGFSSFVIADVDFIDYKLRITPDLANKQINGALDISFIPTQDDVTDVKLLAPNQTIYGVFCDGMVGYSHSNGVLTLKFVPGVLQQSRTTVVNINYLARPRKGVEFGADHLFTQYHTSEWLVSHEDIGDKATIETWLTVPEHYKAVASGNLYRARVKDGLKTYHYRQFRPRPIFTFGFAAGEFKQTYIEHNRKKFRFLYLDANEADIKKMFADVGAMWDFYNQVSSKAFKFKEYTYVVTETNAMQEASGFSLVGRKIVDDALTEPRESWLAAHELAHEWWGNSISAKSWNDFWLNEGLVQFIVAEFKAFKYGRDEYDREITLFKESLMNRQGRTGILAAVSPRKNLSFEEFYRNHRGVAYSKGAFIFHMLKLHLGEKLFWQGIRYYSAKHWEDTVTTEDLQQAFEIVAQRPLDEFFNTWVYQQQDLQLHSKISYAYGQLKIVFEQQQQKVIPFNWQVAYQFNRGDEIKTVEVAMDKKQYELSITLAHPPNALWLDAFQFLPVAIKTEGLAPYAQDSIWSANDALSRYWSLKSWLQIAGCQTDDNQVAKVFSRLEQHNHRLIDKAQANWQSLCGKLAANSDG